MDKKILIIGGDMRNYYLYKSMENDGFQVELIGFDKLDDNNIFDISLIKKSNIVIAPTPFCIDDKLIMPYSSSTITYKELLDNLSKGQLLLAGAIFESFMKLAGEKKIKVVDFLKKDELAILNAIPTAEGAIMKAIELSDETIHGSNIIVAGFGRVGKQLANTLKAMGGKITVVTDDNSETSYAISNGFETVKSNNMEKKFFNTKLIFNTIPFPVIDKDKLMYLKDDSLILDLASKPYGLDHKEANIMNKKTCILPGLPGKTAPKTSSLYIKNTIIKIINEMVEF